MPNNKSNSLRNSGARSGIGKLKNHVVTSKFHKTSRAIEQKYAKFRFITNQKSTEKVNQKSAELEKPLKEGLNLIKLALDSQESTKSTKTKSINKKQNQKSKIDSLLQAISQTLSSSAPDDTACVATKDMQYNCRQLNLHPNTAQPCNFNIVSGDLTCNDILIFSKKTYYNHMISVCRYLKKVTKN